MKVATLEIRPVASAREIDLFHAAGLAAEACNPRWVPSTRHELRQIFGPGSPIMAANDVQPFVALRDGRPVGRIAAVVDGARVLKYGTAIGQFGYLEALDEPEVFDALLASAEAWLRGRGMTRAEGPYSLTINHETGLLVDGFDEPHVVRTNHAPPHYGAHLARLGYVGVMDLLAYSCRPAESDYPERVRRVLARSRDAAEIETAGLDHIGWVAGGRRVNALYNDAWSSNWNAVPVGEAEADFIARLSRPIVKPSWIRMASRRGEPVALVGQIPDANEYAPRDGELLPFGWARLMAGIHVTGTRRSRLAMIGVASRWRGTRVGQLAISRLMAEALEQARAARVEEVEISWMLASNTAILNLVASLPARHTRTFRVFARDLVTAP